MKGNNMDQTDQNFYGDARFGDAEREALYKTIFTRRDVRGQFTPDRVVPVAYLCLGHVSHFKDKPELQTAGWNRRVPLGDVVNFEGYEQGSQDPYATRLLAQIHEDQQKVEANGCCGNFVPKEPPI